MNRNDNLPRNGKQQSGRAGERRPTKVARTPTETRQSAAEGIPAKARLTDRNKQLIGVLAIARYLSNAEIAKLFFSERSPKTMRKRLLRLAGEGLLAFSPPYLHRIFYRAYAGERVEIWAATPRGFDIGQAAPSKVSRS